MARPADFWESRAAAQTRLTSYRLVFRDAYYESGEQHQLPLPPESKWKIELVEKPVRRTVQGHDVVAIDYTFSSVLLTDEASPGYSEPKLSSVGGSWSEPFTLPIDPELLLQRTGFACIDEEDFPFNSVDSEEVDSFYDQDVDVETSLTNVGQAHYTKQPTQSCVDALDDHVGRVDTSVRFERLAWNAGIADTVRYGEVTGDEPDLEIYLPEFAASRVTYRYVHADSCEVVEESVGGTGWRRVLQFATSDENVGKRPLVIGHVDYTVTEKAQELDAHNLFEFSACHKHFHFKYYGDFSWSGGGETVNSKKGFCLQSTGRTANRESSPLHNPFGTCDYQGVEAGWVDQYKAGLPSQWLDTTGFPAGQGERSFTSNPDGLLCEGTLVDADGKALGKDDEAVWGPTDLTAENGEPVEAPRCTLSRTWDRNNKDSVVETISPHGEGMITTDCARGQIGPLRNCGFGPSPTTVTCPAGQTISARFSIPADAAPQVVRITEFSHALNSAIPARYEDSWVPLSPGVSDQPYLLANGVVTATDPAALSFTCPGPRTGGAIEPGGAYSVYTAPVFPDDQAAPVGVT